MESAAEKPEISASTSPSTTGDQQTAENVDTRKRRRSAWMTGAVAIGAVVLEPELLPGIAIGMAAVAVPKLFPGISERIRPAVRSVWRAGQQAVAKGREKAKALSGAAAHGVDQATADQAPVEQGTSDAEASHGAGHPA